MGTPEQLAAGIKRLASRATRAGRDPSEIEVIYRSPNFEIKKESGGERHPFTGTAGEIAADIRQYEELGVDYLLVDFFRITSSFEEALQRNGGDGDPGVATGLTPVSPFVRGIWQVLPPP